MSGQDEGVTLDKTSGGCSSQRRDMLAGGAVLIILLCLALAVAAFTTDLLIENKTQKGMISDSRHQGGIPDIRGVF